MPPMAPARRQARAMVAVISQVMNLAPSESCSLSVGYYPLKSNCRLAHARRYLAEFKAIAIMFFRRNPRTWHGNEESFVDYQQVAACPRRAACRDYPPAHKLGAGTPRGVPSDHRE